VLVSSTFTGKSFFATADCDFRQASVPARIAARSADCPGWLSISFSHFCASGETVAGMGTTRVMCAVPSESKVAESGLAEEGVCAKAGMVKRKKKAKVGPVRMMVSSRLTSFPPL
jgi:hypothetical protein